MMSMTENDVTSLEAKDQSHILEKVDEKTEDVMIGQIGKFLTSKKILIKNINKYEKIVLIKIF